MLVFFGVGSLIANDNENVIGAFALLIGAVLLSWIFGGHFNPWITLATAIRGTLAWLSAIVIVVAQIGGGVLGAALIWLVHPGNGMDKGLGVTRLAADADTGRGLISAILAETLAVFLLACAVFAVGEGRKLGVAMGLAYAVGTLAIFDLTGASMNLARTLGPEAVLSVAGGAADWSMIWVYALSGVLGAASAGLLYPLWATTAAE